MVSSEIDADAVPRLSVYSYDDEFDGMHVKTVTNPEGQVSTVWTHPIFSTPTHATDVAGVCAEQKWDGFGRASAFVQQSGEETIFRYAYGIAHPFESRVQVSGTSNNAKIFVSDHDDLLRRIDTTIPLNATATAEFVHDKFGNLISETESTVSGLPPTRGRSYDSAAQAKRAK